jgi:TRAP transporter TAXI family solute receptor
MIRRLMIPLLALSLCGACSSGDPDGSAATPEHKFLSIGTAPVGGAFFVVGGAIGEVLNENSSAANWQVTAEATKGSKENIRRLDKAEGADKADLDLALANSAISYFAVRGDGEWEKAYPIRAIMTLAPNVALFVAPKGNGVETLLDLAGKRAVVGPAGAGFDYFVRPIVEAHGLSYEAFEQQHATQSGAVELLADGSVSAAFLGGAVPTPAITQASSSQAIHFIPFDDKTVEQLTQDYLFFRRATIPAGTYRGQDEDFNGLDVGSMHLITSADVDEQLIYDVTKMIYENREGVTARHPAGKAINPKNVTRDTGTPFHPGAIRYYKEIGVWPEDRAAD